MKNTTKAGVALSVLSLIIAGSFIFPKAIFADENDGANGAVEREGRRFMFKRGSDHCKGQRPEIMRHNIIQDRADILGLSVDELREKIEGGMTFPEIVEEAGFTKEEFAEKMKDKMKENLDKLVEEGKISSEQAEKMLERAKNMPGKHRGLPPFLR